MQIITWLLTPSRFNSIKIIHWNAFTWVQLTQVDKGCIDFEEVKYCKIPTRTALAESFHLGTWTQGDRVLLWHLPLGCSGKLLFRYNNTLRSIPLILLLNLRLRNIFQVNNRCTDSVMNNSCIWFKEINTLNLLKNTFIHCKRSGRNKFSGLVCGYDF